VLTIHCGSADRVFEEQVRLKFPLLADDAPNKRRRLEIADPHALAIRAALNGCAQSLLPPPRALLPCQLALTVATLQRFHTGAAPVGRGGARAGTRNQPPAPGGIPCGDHGAPPPPPSSSPLAPLTAPTCLLCRSCGMGCSGLECCLGSTHPGMPFPMDLSRIERQTAKAI
jgi:hypothetical protein